MKYVLDIPAIVYRDIKGIENYIALDNPSAAKKISAKIFKTIESFEESPLGGFELRKKFDIGTDLCGKFVEPYIIVFKVKGNIIRIYRVLDARSDYLVRLGLLPETDLDEE